MKYPQELVYRLSTALFVAGLSATLLTGCTNKAQQGFERPPTPVQISVAISQDVPTYLDAIGKTVAPEVVWIQPQVSGRIMKIHFADGAGVKKGDLLFTIDTRPFESKLKQAQANLSRDAALKKQAEANLAKEIAQAKWGLTKLKDIVCWSSREWWRESSMINSERTTTRFGQTLRLPAQLCGARMKR